VDKTDPDPGMIQVSFHHLLSQHSAATYHSGYMRSPLSSPGQ